MKPSLPDAPSVARNREPILRVLQKHFVPCREVLEIGSGSGQHAVYFARALPHLYWQCSDRAENLAGIAAWLAQENLPNTRPPLELDVGATWPAQQYDAIFSANTLHIMSWGEIEKLFQALPASLKPSACVAFYGPFNYAGQYTSPGNAEFDQWLKARGAHQGIRDFEAICALAAASGLSLVEDYPMPANNRCLVWTIDPAK